MSNLRNFLASGAETTQPLSRVLRTIDRLRERKSPIKRRWLKTAKRFKTADEVSVMLYSDKAGAASEDGLYRQPVALSETASVGAWLLQMAKFGSIGESA